MQIIEKLKNKSIRSNGINTREAMELFIEGTQSPYRLMAAGAEIREHFKGRDIIFCGITNAKSGRCSEDCQFCAQSSRFTTNIATYPLKPAREIIESARQAKRDGAELFGIVTSGKRLGAKKEWSEIFKAIDGINKIGIMPCVSVGVIDRDKARQLKDAGLFRYHHNLETGRSYFKNICTTHDYEEDVSSIREAREAGLSVCAGALFGMGEGITHRIELAATLKELDVDSVPLNFLNPIKGTALAHMQLVPPLEALMTIAVYRFMLPDKDIRLCGGKEKTLRQLLPLGIVAGANCLMTGNYLTTAGRESRLDHEMVTDLGLRATQEIDLCRCHLEKMKDGVETAAKSSRPQSQKHKVKSCSKTRR